MGDDPVGYDREWTTRTGRRTRRRIGYSHERGDVTRFVVQLEYKFGNKWQTVVRYDHDAVGDQTHDISREGLHIDIYRVGEKHATEFITGPLPGGVGLSLAEDHLSEIAQRVPQEIRSMARRVTEPVDEEEIEALKAEMKE